MKAKYYMARISNGQTIKQTNYQKVKKLKYSGTLVFKQISIMSHNITNLITINKTDKKVWVVVTATPGDKKQEKEISGKIIKHKDLQIEGEQRWQKEEKAVPIVISTLDAIPKHMEHHLNTIGINKTKVNFTWNSLHPEAVYKNVKPRLHIWQIVQPTIINNKKK